MTDTLRTSIEKFLHFPPIEEQVGNKPKFGRLILTDDRSKEFPLSNVTLRKAKKSVRKRAERKWRARWQGDQGATSMCTAYSFLHFFEHEPVNHPRSYGKYKGVPTPCVTPQSLYCAAQAKDPWNGGAPECGFNSDHYDGSSVLAMMDVAKEQGYISAYHWEFRDVNNVIEFIRDVGPVIVGTNWYRGMELRKGDPNTKEGLLLPTGAITGGHAYLLDEINLTKKGKGREIGVFNSWGSDWGWSGRAYMSIETLDRLLKEDGECVFPEEVP